MTDERLRRWLEAAEQPLTPDPDFAASLHEALRLELGFGAMAGSRPVAGSRLVDGGLPMRRPALRGPVRILLVAALLISGAIGLAALAGSIVNRVNSLTPQEIDLASRVPSAIRSSCVHATHTRAPGSIASIYCPLAAGGADGVTYNDFDPPSTLRQAYGTYVQREAVPAGDCRTTNTATGPWSLGETFNGRLLCFKDPAGSSWIVWTYEEGGQGSGILATASRPDGDWKALYLWWTQTAYYLIH